MSEEHNSNSNSHPVRNMQDLIQFCIVGSGGGENAGSGASMEMDPARKAWLEDAIKAYSVNVVQEMLAAIANIGKELEVLDKAGDLNRHADSSIESITGSIDLLLERTQDLDIAADFDRIGGFRIIVPLLESPHGDLKIKGAELVGELVQNHPQCQASALQAGILNQLVQILDSENDSVKVKALYAISCILRSNPEAQKIFFNNLDGFSPLLRAMQSTSKYGAKLRTKSAFLLSSIIQENTEVKSVLLDIGFMDQIVGLLHQDIEEAHEHLLSTLLSFITDFPLALKEAERKELQLSNVLKNRLDEIEQKPEYLEQERYCKEILKLISENRNLIAPDISER